MKKNLYPLPGIKPHPSYSLFTILTELICRILSLERKAVQTGSSTQSHLQKVQLQALQLLPDYDVLAEL